MAGAAGAGAAKGSEAVAAAGIAAGSVAGAEASGAGCPTVVAALGVPCDGSNRRNFSKRIFSIAASAFLRPA